MKQQVMVTPVTLPAKIGLPRESTSKKDRGVQVFFEPSSINKGWVYEIYTVNLPQRFINSHVIATALEHGSVPVGFCDLRVSSSGQVFTNGCFGSRNESLAGLISNDFLVKAGVPHRDVRFSVHNPHGQSNFLIHHRFQYYKNLITEFYSMSLTAAQELGAKPAFIQFLLSGGTFN